MNNTLNVLARTKHRASFNSSSPLSLLGAGRIDPFSAFAGACSRVHELIDHSRLMFTLAMTLLLPGILTATAKTENSITRAWCSELGYPLLFHTLAFAGSIHLDCLRYEKIYPDSRIALTHKLAIIRILNELLKDPKKAASQDIAIFAILILASHDTMDWLNIFGTCRHDPKHLEAVTELMTLKGGLESLEQYGLSEIFVAGGVISSTRSLTKPHPPPMKSAELRFKCFINWATSFPRPPILVISSAFVKYLEYGISHDMVSTFNSVGAMTQAIRYYVDGEPDSLELGLIAQTRVDVQQLLLSLPRATDTPDALYASIYETCRLTGLIYGIAVILPVPNSYPLFQELVQRLQAALELAQIEGYGDVLGDLHLWNLVMGGIAASDKPERCRYVERLAAYGRTIRMCDWNEVANIMERFLWLDSACEPGGRKLWAEAMDFW
ncbi:hypothetical protein VTL71DRAFT_13266 [Oculimacula yallundae]|uniref:Fungal-specific transcription factor domain-containing protein n=1 Tax=Oculimacula yallundae TaxID=86028 RepID=A0ABR4CKD7_9HELO